MTSSATPYGPSGLGTSQDRAQLGCGERTILLLRGTLKASEIPKISFVSQPLNGDAPPGARHGLRAEPAVLGTMWDHR
jgi:hypothetical protein